MIVSRDLGTPITRPTAVALGKFDGVHRGHRELIERMLREAERRDLTPVVVTFDRNPLQTLNPARCPESITDLDQKLSRLADVGPAASVVLTFDDALVQEPADVFIQRVLVDGLDARYVLVGSDSRFGAGGQGGVPLLRSAGSRAGFVVDVMPDVFPDAGPRRISSTWIRELLAEGDVAQAATLLGRAHTMRGEVVRGLQRGRELGYPTANLAEDAAGFVPADGVYAGWLRVVGGEESPAMPAAISVGTNPTFDDVNRRQVEAYVLGETGLDLYGKTVDVAFVERLRAMETFDGMDALATRMALDVDETRRIMAAQYVAESSPA